MEHTCLDCRFVPDFEIVYGYKCGSCNIPRKRPYEKPFIHWNYKELPQGPCPVCQSFDQAKHIPILFSPAMIDAILGGYKTNTRRIIQNQQGMYAAPASFKPYDLENGKFGFASDDHEWVSPYRPGDILYVREQHYVFGHWIENGISKTGRQKYKFIDHLIHPVLFKAPANLCTQKHETGYFKRLGRFMPKKYTRIWLRVTNVKIERIQNISDQEAIKEGILPNCRILIFKNGEWVCDVVKKNEFCDKTRLECLSEWVKYPYNETTADDFPAMSPRESFQSLWDSINKDRRAPWKDNPYVWAIEFKRIER